MKYIVGVVACLLILLAVSSLAWGDWMPPVTLNLANYGNNAAEEWSSVDVDSSNKYVYAYRTSDRKQLKVRFYNSLTSQWVDSTPVQILSTETQYVGSISMSVKRGVDGVGDVATVGYARLYAGDEQIQYRYRKITLRGASMGTEQTLSISGEQNAHEWFDSWECDDSLSPWDPLTYPYNYYGNTTQHTYASSNGRIKVACSGGAFWFACSVSGILNWSGSNPYEYGFEEHAALYVLPEVGSSSAQYVVNSACLKENGSASGGDLNDMNFVADPGDTVYTDAWFLSYGHIDYDNHTGGAGPRVICRNGLTTINPWANSTLPEIAVKHMTDGSFKLYAAYADSQYSNPGYTYFTQLQTGGTWSTPTNMGSKKPMCVGISNDGDHFYVATATLGQDSLTQLYQSPYSAPVTIAAIGRDRFGERLAVKLTSNTCIIALQYGEEGRRGQITYYNAICSQ